MLVLGEAVAAVLAPSDLYLSKVSDDTAAGKITFKAGARIDSSTGLGRIILDAEEVTSGYNTSIKATDTGLKFSAESNNRGFVFNTGNPATAKVEIKPSGLTYFNEGLRLEGGTIANGSIVGFIDEPAGDYRMYLHGSSASPCTSLRRYTTEKGTFKYHLRWHYSSIIDRYKRH